MQQKVVKRWVFVLGLLYEDLGHRPGRNPDALGLIVPEALAAQAIGSQGEGQEDDGQQQDIELSSSVFP
jgi:hypothetical protein